MKLLLDTNIFLEIILEQDKTEDAKALLESAGENELFISDYSLHSIGLLLFRRKQHDIFQKFILDITVNAAVTVLSASVDDMDVIVTASRRHNLDFDDAYQYGLAEKNGLTLVSFDSDFDRTERGRKTPAEILH
jgi:predicted nucleic acid-binding protein